MAVSSTTTTAEKDQQEQKVDVEFFHIDMIPKAMENMGWEMAPKIMKRWFSISPAYSFDENTKSLALDCDASTLELSRVSTEIVTMSWAMKFQQVAGGIESLKAGWNTLKAKEVLKKRLLKIGYKPGQFGTIGMTDDVKVLDSTAQVNFIRIGDKTDVINDWYGAVGNANLKVCLRGGVIVGDEKFTVTIDALGFYLKDTYDFLDDNKLGIGIPELLGVWGESKILNKAETIAYMSSYTSGIFGKLARDYMGYVPVFNGDFKEWQKKHNAGGDFIVFSDVLWIQPLPKDKVIEL